MNPQHFPLEELESCIHQHFPGSNGNITISPISR